MSIIWRIIGVVSIILGIIGKKRNSRKHNRMLWNIIDLRLVYTSSCFVIQVAECKIVFKDLMWFVPI